MNSSYNEKKSFYDSIITLYGRNVVVEILEDNSLDIHKLHLSESNRVEGSIKKIVELAKKRDIELKYHSKIALSRISKNAKQDQGVAIDIVAPSYKPVEELFNSLGDSFRVLALDGIQNPQNLGMIIRSATAGYIDGIILPTKNSAKISPLVIKASAGTLFKIPIFYTLTLDSVVSLLKEGGCNLYTLSSHAKNSLDEITFEKKSVFILGNESEGVSNELMRASQTHIAIPMQRGVESLNVAITAALIAFKRS